MEKPSPAKGANKVFQSGQIDPSKVELPYRTFFKPDTPQYAQEVADYAARQKQAPTKINNARSRRGSLKLEHQQVAAHGLSFFKNEQTAPIKPTPRPDIEKSHVGETINGFVVIVPNPSGLVAGAGPVDFFKKDSITLETRRPAHTLSTSKAPKAGMKFTP